MMLNDKGFNIVLHHLITLALYDDYINRIHHLENSPYPYLYHDARDIHMRIDNSMFSRLDNENKKDWEIIQLAINITSEIATYRDKIKGKRFYHNLLSSQEITGQQFEIFTTTNSIIYKDKG